MPKTEYLLYPEWQGYGVEPSVHDGAFSVARELFPGVTFLQVPAPREEMLSSRRGVLGLSWISDRFVSALDTMPTSAAHAVVTVGGTCGVEAAPVTYLNERYEGDLAVVWFDAHGDLNSPQTSPSGHFHGMVLRTLTGDGPREYVVGLHRPLRAEQI